MIKTAEQSAIAQVTPASSLPTSDAIGCLLALHKNARLFVADSGNLRRIGAADAYRLLNENKAVTVVTQSGTVTSERSSAAAGSGRHQMFWGQTLSWSQGSSSNDHRTVAVNWNSETVQNLMELALVDPAAPGVPGAQFLPRNGGSAVVSDQFERFFQSSGADVKALRMGVQRSRAYAESGFERVSVLAKR
jgi:hypothetical protein